MIEDYRIHNNRELLPSLLRAEQSGNTLAFHQFCIANWDSILENFPIWMSYPGSILKDDAAMQQYANSIVAIAEYFGFRGDLSLINILQGKGVSPIVKWDAAFSQFEEYMKDFDFAGAQDLLQNVVHEMHQLNGPAIEDRLPFVHERLTWLFFLSGDFESAELHGRASLAGFERNHNLDGKMGICRRLADIFKAAGNFEESKKWIIKFTNMLIQSGRSENSQAVRRLHGIEPLNGIIPEYD